MRGQLTKQLPEDGTGEELFQKIQAEKQVLIKAKRIKKEKQMEKTTDDDLPFAIPENWHWVQLRDLGVFSGGKTPSMAHKGYWENGVVPWVTSKDMKQKYIASSEMLISDAAAKEMAIHPEKTVLFVVRSGILRRLFPVAILTECGTINQDLKALELYIPDMCEYVYYALKGFESTILFKYAKDGTTVNNIIFDALLTMPIPLPPFAEQQRIVDKIDRVFSVLDTIDSLQAQYADNLTALKAKLIDAAIQGKLTEQLPEDGTAEELYQQIQAEKQAFIKAGKIKKEKSLPEINDEEIPFDIPLNWKWVKLGSIARILGGKRIPAGRSLTQEDTGHKYIRVSDMKNRTVQTDGLLFVPEDIYPSISQYIINKEDIYITVAGTIGRVGKIPPEIDGANLTENADRIVFSHLDQDWLIICLSASATQKQIELLTTSVAQPKLAIKRIQEFMIPLPPLDEQHRIVERLGDVLKTIEE